MSRTSSIPGTKLHIAGFPKTLIIYKIPGSSVFQMRAYVAGRLVRRSTKTEVLSQAQATAKAFYHELLLRKAQGKPVTEGSTFKKAVESLLDEDRQRVARGERKESLVRDAESIFTKALIPFFQRDHIGSIDYKRISEYLDQLKNKRDGKAISTSTAKNHLIFLRKVLKHAWKIGMVDKMPVFPTLSSQANPREWFSDQQYKLLRQTIKDSMGTTVKKTYQPIDDELRFVTTFLVNTFLRPADIKNLKNKHIAVVETKDAKYLRINTPDSKTVKSPVVSMEAAVGLYKDLTEFNKAKGYGGPDDYVFSPAMKNRGYAFQTMRLQFNHVLEKAGLKHTDGVPRTL
jgi:hypothetical protein